ncbi:MAG: hypothetical protein LQ342_006387 [Letrouitia transgressa]|nr:MAG: hypothetical protein LQ342_006387 [Letrouitia transgressa]
MSSPTSSGPKGKDWDNQSTYVGSEHSGRSTTTYPARRALVSSVTERSLSDANTRFIPLAKPFDGSASPSPFYPQVLALSSSSVPRPSQGSQGSYGNAYDQGQQHYTAERGQQAHADGNSDTRRAIRRGCPRYDQPSIAQHCRRDSIKTSPTYQPIRRPWDPHQMPEPAPTTLQPSRDCNHTLQSSAQLQSWEREPTIQGPYHGIASVPYNKGNNAKR